MPITAGLHYLNFLYQLMAIRSSSSSSHLRPGAFHMFYKYTTDITYITESGIKKNKWARTRVRPKRKKGEVLALFWHFAAIASVHPNKIPIQLSRKLTHTLVLADLASWSTSPNSSLQQPPLSDRHVSLTVTNSNLLTAKRPCFSSSSSGLVRSLACKPFVWVACQNRQRNLLTGSHPHPRPQTNAHHRASDD